MPPWIIFEHDYTLLGLQIFELNTPYNVDYKDLTFVLLEVLFLQGLKVYHRYFFCSATAIFLNADLTVFAESDFYAFGGFKRYWNKTTGVLGDCETC